MRREKFDFVVGIGSACIASQALRDAGLQHASYPFDWMSGPTFGQRIQTICSGFEGWFRQEDLEFAGNPNGFSHDSYRNRKTNALYPHDFEIGRAFNESYPLVKAKYDRRIDRMYASIRRSKRVLLVWLENPSDDDRPSDEEVTDARRVLSAKFPSVLMEFLIIDRAKDGERNGEVVRREYGWRATCGYRKKTALGASARPWDLEVGPIVAILRRFVAKDWRTRAERRQYRKSERMKTYATLNARCGLDYLLAKIQVKLCRHLEKRLRRRGIELTEGT